MSKSLYKINNKTVLIIGFLTFKEYFKGIFFELNILPFWGHFFLEWKNIPIII